MVRALLLIGICGLVGGAAGCSDMPRDRWIDPEKAVSPVRLDDGICLDLRALPYGWRVVSSSTATGAAFGMPGPIDLKAWPRFGLMVGVGEDDDAFYRHRHYAQAWATPGQPKPSENDPALDVQGFKGHPADDGETVYVSEGLDALMECSPQIGCTIHDGLQPRPGALFVVTANQPWQAADTLRMARGMIRAMHTECASPSRP